jgi:nucleotide-binding universal stress UspA family protein
VPRAAAGTAGRLARVLLPLDGAPGTAAGVARLVGSALAGGAEVVALHVFEPATVPAFWDHAGHTDVEWSHEFLRRNLPREVRLDLRRGDPAHEVLAEVEREDADLVLVGWGQDLAAGRAATVREALSECPVPVLLVRRELRSRGPGTFADHGTGPSTLHDARAEG